MLYGKRLKKTNHLSPKLFINQCYHSLEGFNFLKVTLANYFPFGVIWGSVFLTYQDVIFGFGSFMFHWLLMFTEKY